MLTRINGIRRSPCQVSGRPATAVIVRATVAARSQPSSGTGAPRPSVHTRGSVEILPSSLPLPFGCVGLETRAGNYRFLSPFSAHPSGPVRPRIPCRTQTRCRGRYIPRSSHRASLVAGPRVWPCHGRALCRGRRSLACGAPSRSCPPPGANHRQGRRSSRAARSTSTRSQTGRA